MYMYYCGLAGTATSYHADSYGSHIFIFKPVYSQKETVKF